MTLPTLTLFCTPQDVMDAASVAAIELREDDGNLASGQVILATALASAGSTSIAVAALQYPLLKGTVLTWTEGALEEPATATLNVAAVVGATLLSVNPLAADVPAGAQATDNGVNVWQASLALKACKYATDEVSFYLNSRYEPANLAGSWLVNKWATTFALQWLAERRYNPAPQGVQMQYDRSIKQMESVQAGKTQIPGIASRTASWPFMSNVTVDHNYRVAKVRVEPSISEPTPTQYPQKVDYSSILAVGI